MVSRRTPQGCDTSKKTKAKEVMSPQRSNKSLQPTAAAAMSRFDFMEQFSMLKTLVSASGG
jgi:hypothetical protein